MIKLLLASSSPYRRALLERLRLPFAYATPSIDESASPGESPQQLVERLSRQKALYLAGAHPDAVIIGSDQVACLSGEILTKPGDLATATNQLRASSGRCVTFYTGLCVLNAPTGDEQVTSVTTEVFFRLLDDNQIARYLKLEEPFDCAGSFKCEGLGIALFEKVVSDDPTALVGLPLIELTSLLRRAGFDPLAP